MPSTQDEPPAPTGDDGSSEAGQRAVGPAGRYVLGVLLGRGGMADVYQAHDITLGRDVAVKLLRDRTTDPTDRARFVAEAQTLARLNHPNLVTILDAGISDEHPFLVLELVVGSSLALALARAGEALSPERVATIGAQIAAALAHCHAAGIVHRDVKPGNILLGPGDRALLTDFGISRLLDGSTHHTQTGFTIGTASYLAPEQVNGDELTPAIDMYALGLVLLEACTGRREYAGTPVEAAIARLHRSPRIPVDLPTVLSRVISTLTQTDPARRPDAVATALALITGPPTVIGPSGAPTSLTNAEGRHSANSLDLTPRPPAPVDPHDDVSAAHGPHRFENAAVFLSAGIQQSPPDVYPASRRQPHRRTRVVALTGGTAAAAAAIVFALAPHNTSPTPSQPPTGSASQSERAAASATPRTGATPVAKTVTAPAPPRSSRVATRPSSSKSRSGKSRRARVHARTPAHVKVVKAKKAAKVGKARTKSPGSRAGKGR